MTAASGLIVDFNMTQTSHLYSILTLPLPLGMNLDKVGSVPIIVCSKKAHSVDTERNPSEWMLLQALHTPHTTFHSTVLSVYVLLLPLEGQHSIAFCIVSPHISPGVIIHAEHST